MKEKGLILLPPYMDILIVDERDVLDCDIEIIRK